MANVVDWSEWAGIDNEIASQLWAKNERRKSFFNEDPELFISGSNAVANAAEGDYKQRQLYELVQNATDAMTPGKLTGAAGRVSVVLTQDALYCANEGRPFSQMGFRALAYPYVTGKDDLSAIGQFGLGFCSVASITDNPEVISRSCSVRYSRSELMHAWFADNAYVQAALGEKIINLFPYAIPVDPKIRFADDEVMQKLMSWATTIIKLPLDRNRSDAHTKLKESIETFPPEFLLFCRHLDLLEFEIHDGDDLARRSWSFRRDGIIEDVPMPGEVKYTCERMSIPVSSTSAEKAEWLVFSEPEIPVDDLLRGVDNGLSRARRMDENGVMVPVKLSWAVNIASPSIQRGKFWFHFPTDDEVSLKGIVNAPWDTDAGRTHLLPPDSNGFNKVLLDKLVGLVTAAIPEIVRSTPADHGRFMDLLPARGNEETSVAASAFVPLFWRLAGRNPIVPNLDGRLTHPADLKRWPSAVCVGVMASNQHAIDIANRWMALSRDRDFPHASTFKSQGRNRVLNSLFGADSEGGVS